MIRQKKKSMSIQEFMNGDIYVQKKISSIRNTSFLFGVPIPIHEVISYEGFIFVSVLGTVAIITALLDKFDIIPSEVSTIVDTSLMFVAFGTIGFLIFKFV